MGTRSFLGVKSGRGVTLTPHHLLVPWSWKRRAIPLLPLWAVRPVQSLSARTRVHFTFFFTCIFLTCVGVCACNGVVWDCTWRGVLAPLIRDALWRESGAFTVVVVVAATAAVVGLFLLIMFVTPFPWMLFDVEGGSSGGGEDESVFWDCSCCCNSRCCCWRCVTYSPQWH